MWSEITKQIKVDFYNQKYILINAKQNDELSRYIMVTCYNQGIISPVNKKTSFAYIRYKKADKLNVFNQCEITTDGKILIELTQQMLAESGMCYADLVIICKNFDNSTEVIDDLFDVSFTDENGNITLYNTDSLKVNDDGGNVSITATNLADAITEGKYAVLSTMTFCINVIGDAVRSEEIESSSEFNALNDLMIKATEDYATVITACKTYEENALSSERNADISEANAKTSEINAKASEESAKASEINASHSEVNAYIFATEASNSATKAAESANTAISGAVQSAENATLSINNAEASANSAIEAANSATLSVDSAKLAQSYAVGGTDTRTNEDSDNAQYYYEQTKIAIDNLGGTFIPMGTIEFSELSTAAKEAGYVYHVKDAFITDDTFKSGAGVSYPVGTNVYCTSDGYWDCFTEKNLVSTDDGIGNVIIEYSYDSVETNNILDTLNQTILELQNRIKQLEEQNVLEIVE